MGSPERRAFAASPGAAVFPDLSEVARADAVLDFVGTDETVTAGIALVRPGGAFGLMGPRAGDWRRPGSAPSPATARSSPSRARRSPTPSR